MNYEMTHYHRCTSPPTHTQCRYTTMSNDYLESGRELKITIFLNKTGKYNWVVDPNH